MTLLNIELVFKVTNFKEGSLLGIGLFMILGAVVIPEIGWLLGGWLRRGVFFLVLERAFVPRGEIGGEVELGLEIAKFEISVVVGGGVEGVKEVRVHV